jgi:hypothetical protein
MIGYQNPTLGYVLWIIAVLLLLIPAWPWLKRWRPLTLAPEQGALAGGTEKPALLPVDPSELAQLKTKITEAEQERDSAQSIIEQQQERLDRWSGERLRFKELLREAWVEGTQLRESEPSDDEVEEWKDHMRVLLEAALGKGTRVDSVVKDDPTFESAVHGSTSEQKQIERSTNRLHDLIEWVESPQAIPFRSGFDPHKWEDWKSPPPTTEQARIDRLQGALSGVVWERDSLRRKVHELEMMSPEEYRSRQDERRKRIKRWRAEIETHVFTRLPLGGSLFAHTDTYSEMRPHLAPGVRQRYEARFHIGADLFSPRKMGREGDRRVILEEVARIEKEWGVV